ncbi:S8 family serine peptidase [Haloferula sp.]|uniref:S8 family serine peptidase n=1 Tax=Haloferula sp. TaxID=2497595 RepID=UPI00329D99BE
MSGKVRITTLTLFAAGLAVALWRFAGSDPKGSAIGSIPDAADAFVEPKPAAWIEPAGAKTASQVLVSDPDEEKADLLSQRVDLSDPKKRAELVAAFREVDEVHGREVARKAAVMGLEMRGTREDGTEWVLSGFDGDMPIYEQTENARAAISTAADLVRSTAPFNVDGAGELIGMWEVNQPRARHDEFGSPSRLTFGQGSSGTSDHATHVAGTMIAAGLNSSLMGMAPGAEIISYSSASDSTEMMNVGAAVAGEAGKINVSNHSYGFGTGWEGNDWRGVFIDDANTANDYEADFGLYSSLSRLMDGLTYNLPYYLPFFSAGNHRNDNAPLESASWTHSFSTYSYDSSRHPAGDNLYKSGYDLCEGKKVAKNVMTVGAVTDATIGSSRSLTSASQASFSSSGPTDDGRIKPDIVANGVSLTSAGGASDNDTTTFSGTSMSSPNAAGSAALLVDYYKTRFPGGGMRAATLKGLIIHTADDLGNEGPDYRYGWGLMNTLSAAELIKDHADDGERMVEDRLTTVDSTKQYQFHAIGGQELRVTLSWTDPAGTSKTGHENRTKALVNDLNLSIQGPDGTLEPFVMPHVGDWSVATLDDVATTGVNNVDNVEQIHLPDSTPGLHTITVTYTGSLTESLQDFSLILTGFDEPLQVDVGDGFNASGLVGGPFGNAVRDFTLTNQSSGPVEWTASDDVTWLDLSANSGEVLLGSSEVLTAELNATAESLPVGLYEGEITITSSEPTAMTAIPVSLLIYTPLGLPFVEDFEGSLGSHWEISGTAAGRTVLTDANGPHAGLQHLTMDAALGGGSSRNELTLTIDLAGAQDLELSFWAREFGDELHVPPPSPFVGGADFDGVAVSEDGINWYSVLTFPSAFGTYTEFVIDLDAAIDAHGLSYGSGFKIRFNQYDNTPIAFDGIAIDDIRLFENGPPEIAIENEEGESLVDEATMIGVGSLPVGTAGDPITLTIQNSGGGELSGLAVTADGANSADFAVGPLDATSLAAGEETEFTVTFSPGDAGSRTAAIHVASNDADESFFDIQMAGIGLHTLESWRQEYYQTTVNAGDAADLADPNMDGISNLMAFALGLNPLEPGVVPLELEIDGDELMVSYQRSRAGVAAGLIFDIEWSDTLQSDWATAGVSETVESDDGLLQQVEANLAKGTGKRFVRLQVTKP